MFMRERSSLHGLARSFCFFALSVNVCIYMYVCIFNVFSLGILILFKLFKFLDCNFYYTQHYVPFTLLHSKETFLYALILKCTLATARTIFRSPSANPYTWFILFMICEGSDHLYEGD